MTSPNVGKGEVLNVSGETAVSVNEIAKKFNHPIEYLDPRPSDPKHYLGDISKIKELLGWEPQITFDEGFDALMKLWGLR
jgi:nucleoside-diphosphate-sugar epimerase